MRLITREHLAVLKAASTDETRYLLNGVYFEETKDGLKATATDGRILVQVETKGDKAADFPEIPALKEALNTETKAIVPTEALKSAKKNLPKHSAWPMLQNVALKLSRDISTMATTNLATSNVIPAKNIEGKFPDYKRVIPLEEPTFKITISATYLRKLADMVEEFTDFKGAGVRFEFYGELQPAKVTASKGDTTFTAVVMPMKE